MRNVIGFHRPEEENGYLSNWYLANFTVDGIEYSSMEQYMMHKKAVLFEDENVAGQIMQTTDVENIKALGRSIVNYNDVIWNGEYARKQFKLQISFLMIIMRQRTEKVWRNKL